MTEARFHALVKKLAKHPLPSSVRFRSVSGGGPDLAGFRRPLLFRDDAGDDARSFIECDGGNDRGFSAARLPLLKATGHADSITMCC